MSRVHTFRKIFLSIILIGLVALPALAQAQRRVAVRGPGHRSVVFVGGFRYGGFGYPAWGWGWGPWYPIGPFGPYPYGYYPLRVDTLTSSARLDVKPRNAEVYIDGYRAGIVDDFDGFFQRLRVSPGEHEIVLYLEGYRTVRESIYFQPNSNQRIELTLTPLAPGESAGPRPEPVNPPEREARPERPSAPPRRMPAPGQEPRAPESRFGTLSLRVQPADASIFVDGQRWDAPEGQTRLTIELSEGRHQLEVRKEGFTTYAVDVLIRRGQTNTVNVSLDKSR